MKTSVIRTTPIIVLMLISSLSFSQLITIGTGTLQNTNTTWPAPYGNWYTGARHQILISATDIYAAGGGPGVINSIAFDVATPQGVALTGWEIKMGATSTADLTTWETGLTVVSSPGSYTEFAGWNTHVFTTPFVWDGVSNIVIETCFDLFAGSSNYTNSAIVNQTATSYNSTIVYYTDGGAACTTPTISQTYLQRPNIQMDIITTNAPVNLGILPYDYPTDFCGLPPAINLRTKVKNWGTAAQSNFDVSYSIDGGTTWITETNTNIINPGDTVEHIFSSTVDFSVPGIYTIEFAVFIAGDTLNYNDTLNNIQITNNYTVNIFPYFQDFEGSNYWATGGNNSTWEIGTPAGVTIIGAGSGNNSWITGLTTNYNNNENSWVLGPCFDFSSLVAPIFEMKAWWNSENSWDGAALQYSLDGGTTWTHVGAYLDPNNWYTDNTVNGLAFSGNQEGWCNNTPTDWLTVKHNLTGLGGISNVKLRIAFGSDGSVNSYDGFAFDDILIYETPTNDLSVVEWIAPVDDCILSASENVTITIANYGLINKYDFPVSYSIDGGATFTTPEIITDTIYPGDSLIYTFVTQADFSAVNIYDCFAVVADPLDEITQNDTLNTSVTIFSIITLPYSENFETFTTGVPGTFNNGWSYYAETTYQWQVDASGTPTANTGPSVDHTLGTTAGIYVYTEASNGVKGDSAYIISPCVDLSTYANANLTFWYHMSGIDVDTLAVDIFDGTVWTDNVFIIVGEQQANQTDPWLKATANLTPYILTMQKFRIRAVRGVAGEGDIAIDDIYIEEIQAVDITPVDWLLPQSGCQLTNSDSVTVNFYNNGLLAIDSILVGYSIDGGATIIGPEMILDTIYPGDTLTYTFSATADFSLNGIYNCSAFIMDISDMNNLNDTIFTSISNDLVNILPYSENFETFTVGIPGTFNNGWDYYAETTYQWQVNAGGTGSTNTGPTVDHTLGTTAGIYVYTEASSGIQGDTAWIISPCVDLSSYLGANLTFWYHMWGPDFDTLAIDVFDGINWTDNIFTIVGEQQANQNDLWQMATVSITPYIPTMQKFRFRGLRGASYGGDISIDDIYIEEPPPFDISPVEWVSPQTSCQLSNSDSIIINFYNNGLFPQDSILVGYSIDGGATIVGPEMILDTIYPGDTLAYTFSVTADFSVNGTYNCSAFIMDINDQNNLNDTILISIINNTINTIPYTEDFETFTVGAPGVYENGWSINPTTGYTWNVNSGTTPTTSTGPLADHTTGTSGGKYVYTEATNGVPGDVAELYFPCIDLSGYTIPAISFWYHMYGNTIDTLYVDIFDGGIWNNGIFSLIGQQQPSGSDPWLMAQVDVSSYLTATEIRFRAIRGSGDLGDISLDDINIMEPTIDVGATEVSGPNSSCTFTIPSHIVIKVANFGTTTINTNDTIPIAIEVNGSPAVTEPFVLSSALATGNTQFFVSVNTYDFTTVGSYNIVAYTIMSGDISNFNDTIYGTVINYGNPIFDLGTNITTTQPDTVVLDAGAVYASYFWQDSTTAQTFNVVIEGWYYVTVTDTNGCSANDSIYVGNSLSAEQLFVIENTISIFPNPNNGIFTINASNEFVNDWVIELINVQGQIVSQIKIDNVNHFNKTIDVSKIAKGLYYIKINNNKGFMIDKIIIK